MAQLRPQIQQFKQQMNQLQSLRNPQAMLNQMLLNNPKIYDVLNFIKQNGNDPQAALRQAAQNLGINPDELLRELQSQ